VNAEVLAAAQDLVQRAESVGIRGRVADPAAMEAAQKSLGGMIPDWYVELLTTVPLCRLEIGWEKYLSAHEPYGVELIRWSGPSELGDDPETCPPAIRNFRNGSICVGTYVNGTEPYVMPVTEGDDPPIYQVYHDTSSGRDEVLFRLVCRKLSVLFRVAMVRGPQEGNDIE
jgi:hypothetical protein